MTRDQAIAAAQRFAQEDQWPFYLWHDEITDEWQASPLSRDTEEILPRDTVIVAPDGKLYGGV